MKTTIQIYLNLFFRIGLLILILSTLFLFTNYTTEAFDSAKFFVLFVFVGTMLILISIKFILDNRISFVRTPFDLPLILLLAVSVASTFASASPYVSLLGQGLRVHTSLVSLALYILFYFVLTQNLKSETQIRGFLAVSLWAGAALSAVTLTFYFGIKVLPISWIQNPNFTPTGSSFSTGAILVLLLPIVVSSIISSGGILAKTLNAAFLTLFGVTIALTGNLSTYVAGVFGVLVTFFVLNPLKGGSFKHHLSNLALVATASSLIVIGAVVLLSFLPTGQNPLYSPYKNFPREIQLPFDTSWKISVSSFRDSPFWGTGPSSFLFNFTTYKPAEFNASKLWNIRFDSAFNEYLQVLSTLGGVGLLAFFSITVLFVLRAIPALRSKHPLNCGLAVSGISFFIIASLHALSLPLMIMGLLIFAMFWILNWREVPPTLSWVRGDLKQAFLKLASVSHTTEQVIKIDALPSIILTTTLGVVLFAAFFGGKFYMADLHHKNAIGAVSQNNGVLAYNELILAEKLNPYNDLYRTDLAQVNFALANAIAQAKGPTEAAPQGSLTDTDKQNIQVLLQQSITEGKTATTLSPRSAANWEILGLLYRQIAGVAENALLFSLDSYGRAIFNDPLNPALRLNVGGVYYAVKSYDLAIRFFTDSINLKPDYANGYYNLSVALRDKGDLNAAIAAAEKVITLVEADSSDYKVAIDYLNNLKTQAGIPTEPPAATTSGELQDEDLPKVIDLPKPDKIATPEAIKKPSPTPAPSP